MDTFFFFFVCSFYFLSPFARFIFTRHRARKGYATFEGNIDFLFNIGPRELCTRRVLLKSASSTRVKKRSSESAKTSRRVKNNVKVRALIKTKKNLIEKKC